MNNTIRKINDILSYINTQIEDIHYTDSPYSLFEPLKYILDLGGKRIRPLLTLMSYNLYANDIQKALPIALGLEVFHNFTLMHDDLMDKAEIRRGKPSVHIKWSDNTAILSGDVMLIESYKEISKIDHAYLVKVLNMFSKTATQICCGQQLDMEFETKIDISIDEYIEMITLKTAVLLGCSLYLGALVADAPQQDLDLLYSFGINIGLAFQLQDDLLDVYGDISKFGKKIGGDITSNKKTFLLLNALKENNVRDELLNWVNCLNCNEAQKIAAVTKIYNDLHLKEKTETMIENYYNLAISCLDKIQIHKDQKKELYVLTESIITRNS